MDDIRMGIILFLLSALLRADDPEVVVYVAIDSPKSSVVFGSTIAAPIVGQIIEDIAPIIGLEVIGKAKWKSSIVGEIQ